MYELNQMVAGYGLEDESFGDEFAVNLGIEDNLSEVQDTEKDVYSV